MAQRGNELNTRITASDEASAVVDKVAKKVGDLEDGKHEITLAADDQASDDIADVASKLSRLTKDEQRIVLSARADQLEREVDRALKKLARVKDLDGDEIDVIINAKDNASKKLDDARRQLAALDGDEATVKVSANIDDLASKLGEVDGIVGSIGGQLGKLATPGGAVAAIAVGLGAAGEAAADAAVQIDNTSKLTGDSVEMTSKLLGIWKSTGAEVNDFQDVMLQMNGVLRQSPELAKQLGINMDDGRSIGERFVEVVGRLGEQYEDAGKRGEVASQLFGEEGVRQVNAVTAAYGDLGKAVDDYSGKVWTDQEIADAREYQRELRLIKEEFGQIAAEIGSDVVPAASGLLKLARDTRRTLEEDVPGGGFLGDASRKVTGFVTGLGPLTDALKRIRDDSDETATAAADAITTRLLPAWEAVGQAALDVMNGDIIPLSGQTTQAMDAVAYSIDAAKSNLNRFGDDGVENMNDVGDAAGDTRDAIGDIRDELEGLRTDIANDQSALDLADQFDQLRAKAIDAFGAAREGAADAEEKQRDYQSEINRTKQDVIDYATEVLRLPAEQVTRFVADIDEGRYAEVEAKLALLARNRFAVISPSGTQGGAIRHAGGPVRAGEVITAERGEEFSFIAPADGMVRSREDVARRSGAAGGPEVYIIPPAPPVKGGHTFVFAPNVQGDVPDWRMRQMQAEWADYQRGLL